MEGQLYVFRGPSLSGLCGAAGHVIASLSLGSDSNSLASKCHPALDSYTHPKIHTIMCISFSFILIHRQKYFSTCAKKSPVSLNSSVYKLGTTGPHLSAKPLQH